MQIYFTICTVGVTVQSARAIFAAFRNNAIFIRRIPIENNK